MCYLVGDATRTPREGDIHHTYILLYIVPHPWFHILDSREAYPPLSAGGVSQLMQHPLPLLAGLNRKSSLEKVWKWGDIRRQCGGRRFGNHWTLRKHSVHQLANSSMEAPTNEGECMFTPRGMENGVSLMNMAGSFQIVTGGFPLRFVSIPIEDLGGYQFFTQIRFCKSRTYETWKSLQHRFYISLQWFFSNSSRYLLHLNISWIHFSQNCRALQLFRFSF